MNVARGIFIVSLLLHIAFLASLAAHFDVASWWPLRLSPNRAAEAPVFTGLLPPDALDTPPVFERFAERSRAKKIILPGDFMKIPPRQTSNRWLDFLVRDSTRTDPGGDFFQIYRAGLDLRFGVSSMFPEKRNNQAELVYPGTGTAENEKIPIWFRTKLPLHPPNRYLPGMIYLFGYPLSLFRPWESYALWVAVHELVLACCVLLCWRLAPRTPRFYLTGALWLTFLPYYLEMYMGQTSFLVMGAIMAIGYSLQRSRGLLTDAAWSLSLIVKPLTLLLVPLFVRLRQWRVLAVGFAALAAANAPYFATHPADFKLFVSWAFGQEMVTNTGNACFQNLVHHFTFSPAGIQAVTWLFIAASLALTFFGRRWDPVDNLCLWIATYFLIYAHVWEHHYVMVLPVLALLMLRPGIRWIYPVAVLFTLPSPFFLFEGRWNWYREVLYLAAKSVPVLLLYLGLAKRHIAAKV